MYGAILGDMIGAPYEFDRAIRRRISRCLQAAAILRTIP